MYLYLVKYLVIVLCDQIFVSVQYFNIFLLVAESEQSDYVGVLHSICNKY
jgi:hypothetical protein